MIDTLNMWIDTAATGGNPFAIAACLSDVEESKESGGGTA